MSGGRRNNTLRTVTARVMNILSVFSKDHPVLGLSEISRRTGLSSPLIGEPSPAHRISDTASGRRSAGWAQSRLLVVDQNSIARVRWGTQALSTPELPIVAILAPTCPRPSLGRLPCGHVCGVAAVRRPGAPGLCHIRATQTRYQRPTTGSPDQRHQRIGPSATPLIHICQVGSGFDSPRLHSRSIARLCGSIYRSALLINGMSSWTAASG